MDQNFQPPRIGPDLTALAIADPLTPGRFAPAVLIAGPRARYNQLLLQADRCQDSPTAARALALHKIGQLEGPA